MNNLIPVLRQELFLAFVFEDPLPALHLDHIFRGNIFYKICDHARKREPQIRNALKKS